MKGVVKNLQKKKDFAQQYDKEMYNKMNIEQGISNYEVFLSFNIHYSLFIIRYSLLWLFVPLCDYFFYL
ncbi:hypothetical protein BIY37_04385 [Candidatus Brocadia sapporoensis]|uniref:Uncharacterized protein n=1 Tax=Candidatus Brocadia sapporoensis TaxID=392547 RepID=A0A1V6M1L8_9BACT|nr:hypothetical protein BIY37_04385 [Candidatus Brocadia sapporoensis]